MLHHQDGTRKNHHKKADPKENLKKREEEMSVKKTHFARGRPLKQNQKYVEKEHIQVEWQNYLLKQQNVIPVTQMSGFFSGLERKANLLNPR